MKIILTVFIIAVVAGVGAYWNHLRVAHSTFENYYAFRGCTSLIEKTASYGVCKTASGQTIKIVLYSGRWYLDGDLPYACIGKFCFGI